MQILAAAIWKIQAEVKAKTGANQEKMEALQEAIRAIQVELKAS
jgi:hypothetical protein